MTPASAPVTASATDIEGLRPPASVPDTAPLSFGQRRLWFLEQMEPGSALYNIPYLLRLRGQLDVPSLERALQQIVDRHSSLRTVLTSAAGEPVQLIAPTATVELATIDLGFLAPDRREAELRRLAGVEARRPFDLSGDLMLRAQLYQLGPGDQAVMLVLHHAAADGWSMGILYRELSVFYRALRENVPAELPELPIQYADYAAWQQDYFQGPTLQRLLDYWKERLSGAPPLLELPTDRPRPAIQTYRGEVEVLTLAPALLSALKAFSREQRVTLFMTLLSGFNALLHRLTDRTDIVVGSPLAGRDRPELEGLIGFFVNFLVLRTDVGGDPSFRDLIGRVRETTLAAYDHQNLPFEKLVEEVQPKRNLNHGPVCQIAFALQNAPGGALQLPGLEATAEPIFTGTAKFDLTISASEELTGLRLEAEFSTDIFERATVGRILRQFQTLLAGAMANPAAPISRLPLLDDRAQRQLVVEWNATAADYSPAGGIDGWFEAQVALTPEAPAVVCRDQTLSYRELNRRADLLAAQLRRIGVGPEVIVGLSTERTLAMMVGLLGILKSGGAYLPLDPGYPAERLAFMLSDSRAQVLVTQAGLPVPAGSSDLRLVVLSADGLAAPEPATAAAALAAAAPPHSADRLAYVLYTSGSTGKPKGVMVTHRNVLNFFAGMDRVLGREPGVWLAVTSISFDISGLELFWTLGRGYKVVLLTEEAKREQGPEGQAGIAGPIPEFSLFYFGDDGGTDPSDRYRLVMEGARFADANGFEAVWTPERHFHSFGGSYPNPAITGAAIAAVTQRVKIRAGSVVLPLHHPLSVAEDWSMIDNLSHGRVGISFASGWHDRDFVLAPQNFAARKEVMRQGIDTVRRLWRGDAIVARDGAGGQSEVKIFPRPIQPELPFWVTAAGNPETFRLAGEMGANILTHLLGQTPDELARKIGIYRAARRTAGYDAGRVTLALHTFVGENQAEVKATVQGPFCAYLLKSLDLLKDLTAELFPGMDVKELSNEEKKILTDHAFNRYYETSGLLGTPESCQRLLGRLGAMGVNEVACLIDFGVPVDQVIASFASLGRLRTESRKPKPVAGHTLAEEIARQDVTHLQCTPSFARMLLQNPEARRELRHVRRLLVGGEALPTALAEELRAAIGGELENMYGPTETTIWSTTARVEPGAAGGVVPLGRPIANTQVYILDRHLQPTPVGVAGELHIGGDGVARGYLHRPELSAERFLPDPFRPGGRIYRTGDLARYRSDGVIEFLGRTDQQVKLRGYRIELGEIEAVLASHAQVRNCAVVVRTDQADNPRLTAYLVASGGASPTAAELKEFFRAKLPEHMVPSDYVALTEMPLTPNGKLDRKALPAPGDQRASLETVFVAPQAGLEQTVATIWADILGAKNPGADDNFFDLGGHSLLVVRVQSRIREALGVNLSVLKLFQYPTIRTLTRHIAESKDDGGFLDKIRDRGRRQRAAMQR